MVRTYILEVSEEVGGEGGPLEFLQQEDALDGLGLVLAGLVGVAQVDLLDEFAEEVLVEVGAELLRKLRRKRGYVASKVLTCCSSRVAAAMAFLLLMPAMMNWICHRMALGVLSCAEQVVSRRKAPGLLAGWSGAGEANAPLSCEGAWGSCSVVKQASI